MPVYSLYLNTQITNGFYLAQCVNRNQVSWNINWDNLFQGDNLKYQNCRVRYNFISTHWTSGSEEWNAYVGYLSCSLPAKNQANRNYNGTILGLLYPTRVGGLDSTATTVNAFNNSSLQEIGVDVNVPVGSGTFTVNLIQDNPTGTLMSWTTYPEWSLFLTFELY